ncbi:MAG: hypothetical protein RR557_07110 [Bacilli bacterium]
MKKYQIKLVDTIASIHDLYDRTKDAAIDKNDKEFIENLACTVEMYFKNKLSSPVKSQETV